MSWYDGRGKIELKPPPESIQPISSLPALAWQVDGGSVLSTVRVDVFAGSWQRYVPPTPVTSGSEPGQPTFGNWSTSAPLPVMPCLFRFVLPKSPDEASTVTPASFASSNA